MAFCLRRTIITILVFSMFGLSACSNQMTRDRQNAAGSGSQVRTLNFSPDDARIPLVTQNGIPYLSLLEFTKAVGFQTNWNAENQSLSIGDIDPFYRLTVNSNQADKEEQLVQLSSAPVLINGAMHAPVDVIADMFQEDIHYKVENNDFIVHGVPLEPGMDDMDVTEETATIENNFFEDDPNDPFKGDESANVPGLTAASIGEPEQNKTDLNGTPGDSFHAAALKNIDINALVREAKRYIGVPYEFGTGPYPITKKFDCSTYTQYVFGKFGIKLMRVSRNQAKQGVPVSRKLLRKGDLLFFSVPGRFKSNKTVGHVGIYIGNGQMINTFSNKKGVHIAYVNKGYWAKKFLSARRVAI